MEQNPAAPEFTEEEQNRMREHLVGNVSQYVRNNPNSTNPRLFGFLALLNNYVPESYLSMPECQKILGPPDPIHGGPPFEQRMEPFTQFIMNSDSQHIAIHPDFAEITLEVLVNSGITMSSAVKNLMSSLCGDEHQPDTIEFVKNLLTKREMGEKGKEKFSNFIQDICVWKNPYHSICVLRTASNIMRRHHVFPQTLSRFYYIRQDIKHHKYERAERWAHQAIERAPNNSFVADTLGQVYKNRLLKEGAHSKDIPWMVGEAWQAFKEVEKKAEREVGPEMEEEAGALYITNTFNNRGYFGLIQVAKIAHEKLRGVNDDKKFLEQFRTEVEAKFDFFEWYLTYSKPGKTFLEPPYFWKDVAYCYKYYTGDSAADSISFPGLLERLNRGLFTSRGRYSGLVEVQETLSELESICDDLKTDYEADVDDDKEAERYILSNVILSNRAPYSPSLAPLTQLRRILSRFLNREARNRSPEFYLLVLLLFWPQEDPQVVQEDDEEEVERPRAVDLRRCVADMERAFEVYYSNYLRGRYLVPLFFLGKGFGLSKWIHKSKLDQFVETEVDERLALENIDPNQRTRQKWKLIDDLWTTGEVWQIPAIQEILQPVMIDPDEPFSNQQDQREKKVFVFVGGRRILATIESESDTRDSTESESDTQVPTESESDALESTESEYDAQESTESEYDAQESTESEYDAQEPRTHYLGFTIKGPVVYNLHMPTCSECDQ